MPLQPLQIAAGVNREVTAYADKGGWFLSDKVRFRSGNAEKIGGWVSISNPNTYSYVGVCRDMWTWITLSGSILTSVGTNQKFYIEFGGAYYDVTPLTTASPITLGTDPFYTTTNSLLVTVTATSHGATVGTWVTFSGATAFNGVTISGAYEIVTVPSLNSYTIALSTTPTNTGSGGGSSVVANYNINAGSAVYTTGTGWSAGTWGGLVSGGTNTGWGSSATVGLSQLILWTSDNFGQNLLLAQRQSTLYYWQAPASTSSFPAAVSLSSLVTWSSGGGGNAPSAPSLADAQKAVPNYVLQVMSSDIQEFVIAFGCTPFNDNASTAFNPLLVRWSNQGSEYDWYPALTNSAGDYVLSGGSTIVCAQYARQEILIWTDTCLFSMQYVGTPYIWSFTLLMPSLSIMSPNAHAMANNTTMWMGRDKFYTYNGTVSTLPCTLRKYIFGNINIAQAYQIVASINEGFSEVWWFYPSLGSNVNDSYVIYNYVDNAWSYGTINRTYWLDSAINPYPMAAFSIQNSYLSAAITATATSITLVDASSYPDVGAVIIGTEYITYTGNTSNTLTGCVRGANGTTAAAYVVYTAVNYYIPNQLMFHEDGVDDGSLPTAVPIYSYVQSGDFDIGAGEQFSFVWRMLPDVTFDGSTVNDPSVNISLLPRQNSGTAYGAAVPVGGNPVVSSQDYTTVPVYNVQQFTGEVYTRIRGRQLAFKIESTGLGCSWQLGITRFDIRPDGRKS